MKEKIIAMLAMQDKMNSKVHSDWADQGFEWYRAIWVECAEINGSLRLEVVEKAEPRY